MLNDEQWQELYKWSGFTRRIIPVPFKNPTEIEIWVSPDGKEMMDEEIEPSRDMNMIFKWIWPKLTPEQRKAVLSKPRIQRLLIDWTVQDGWIEDGLSEAVYEVLKESGS